MTTRVLFAAVVLIFLLGLVRDWVRSGRHTQRLLEIGAQTFGNHQTRGFFVLSGIWAVACVGEVWGLQRTLLLIPALLGLTLMVLGRFLRRSARSALGQRWTLDVVSTPGNPLVTGQIYDRMRHPEYAGTFLLFLGVPLLHGAWITLSFTVLAGLALLVARVQLEEAVLDEDARYMTMLGDRPRFFPRKTSEGSREPSNPTRLRPRTKRGDIG